MQCHYDITYHPLIPHVYGKLPLCLIHEGTYWYESKNFRHHIRRREHAYVVPGIESSSGRCSVKKNLYPCRVSYSGSLSVVLLFRFTERSLVDVWIAGVMWKCILCMPATRETKDGRYKQHLPRSMASKLPLKIFCLNCYQTISGIYC